MKIKTLHILLLLVFSLNTVFAQNRAKEIQTNSKLAVAYFNEKDFEKAAPLFLEVYNLSRNSYYFRMYIRSMIEQEKYEEATTQIEQEISQSRGISKIPFFIHWGYILKLQEKPTESGEKYNRVLEMIDPNAGSFHLAARTFLNWGEYEWAGKVYKKGRETLEKEDFSYEMARVYLYLRNYDKMLEEYLNVVREDTKMLSRVQSNLSSALRLDVDGGLREQFRTRILKRIQAEPNVIAYNRLMIWFLLQEKQFSAALRQSISLDRRTGNEQQQIYQLGQMALNNKQYSDAVKAFEYVTGKGREENPFYGQAYAGSIHASYLEYTGNPAGNAPGKALASRFEEGLEFLGYTPATLDLIREYAHLLAFYLDETGAAIAVLEKGLEMPRLKPEQTGRLKTEMADIYLFANDPWEATLLYSQVIEANKNNALGDEVKMKKARLGYYTGNFSWAKAQLDVLKASTSKLIANDAMELSMLIGNNMNLDTTAVPLEMFARADLLFFRNKDSLALVTLDSIADNYPYHTLVDDILFRKSKIEMNRNNYEKAAKYLQQIRSDFSYELLADDALFMLAELKNYHLGEKEEAKALYKEMLTRHPGSVFIEESREKFRELRKLYPDEATLPEEKFLLEEKPPANEIN